MKVNNLKTKEESKLIRNWFGCGCDGDHEEDNDNCEYALIKKLLASLPDEKSDVSLWWNTTKNKWNRQGVKGMQKDTVGQAMERLNRRFQISSRKLNGNMGRKTLATLGRARFSYNDSLIRQTGNWETQENMENYVDSDYENIERETIITRNFQQFEQGFWRSDIQDSVPHHLSEIRRQLTDLADRHRELVDRQARIQALLVFVSVIVQAHLLRHLV